MRLAFETIHGIAVPAVTVPRMEQVWRTASNKGGLQWTQFVENAGRSLAITAIKMLGTHWMESRILVLAGEESGNGAFSAEGGICAARHLANRGASVSLCLTHPRRLSSTATLQHKSFRASSGFTVTARQLRGDDFDLVIDALEGATETPKCDTAVKELILWANDIGSPVLALDAPTGINATTGEHQGTYIRAQQTMTLGLPKTGLLPELTGQLSLADMGVPLNTITGLGISYTPPFGVDFVVPMRALPTA